VAIVAVLPIDVEHQLEDHAVALAVKGLDLHHVRGHYSFVAWLSRSAALARDATTAPPVHSMDPNDDYLIALAAEQKALLVTGDRHLLAVAGSFPLHEPAAFLAMLAGPTT
jgi:hypothetical protein